MSLVSASNANQGTHTHMAPELLQEEKFGPPVDVYSFAITMLQVFDYEAVTKHFQGNTTTRS